MRNLPPRMSNQPARKAWEIEVPNGEIASNKFEQKTKYHASNERTSQMHENYISRNQQLYDDTGNRIAYRGGWIGRGGRGWGVDRYI